MKIVSLEPPRLVTNRNRFAIFILTVNKTILTCLSAFLHTCGTILAMFTKIGVTKFVNKPLYNIKGYCQMRQM